MKSLRPLIIFTLISVSLVFWSQPLIVDAQSSLFIKVTVNQDLIVIQDFPVDPVPDTHAEVTISEIEGGKVLWQDNNVTIEFGEVEIDGVEINKGNHIKVVGKPSDTMAAYTVQELEITGEYGDSDKVSGVAEPGRWVSVVAKDMNSGISYAAGDSADENGHWTAQFNEPINAGLKVNAFIFNDDDHQTKITIYPPYFTIERLQGWLQCYDFPPNSELLVEIFDESVTLIEDYYILADEYGECDERDYPIEVGYTVKVTESRDDEEGVGIDRYKSTEVRMITLEYVDENFNYSGYCPGCSQVEVTAYEPTNYSKGFGDVVGDRYQFTLDTHLEPGKYYWREANVYDEDGDSTMAVSYRVNLWSSNIQLRDFEPGQTVYGSIFNQDNELLFGPHSVTIDSGGYGRIRRGETGMIMLPGYRIEVRDGDDVEDYLLETLTIADTLITEVDYESDSVSGIAAPESIVEVIVENDTEEDEKEVQTDVFGNWEAVFSEGILENMLYFHANTRDWDGDVTWDHYIITSLSAPLVPVEVNTPVSVSTTLNSPEDFEHYVLWNLGDGTSTSEEYIGNSPATSHDYSSPGVYTLTLEVRQFSGAYDHTEHRYIVVYDPEGGFVTGGGWIDSPAGAYIPDPSLSGKANFGFVSKYKKNAQVPTGNTEFQFKAGDLNFHSSSYDWLVVTGSDYARFKGIGTINGEGEYKFMVWAGDKEPDTFRIKIWEEIDDVETVVYDNGMDQELGGGNIVVHKAKKK